MSRGWSAFAILLALVACLGIGYGYGRHVTLLAWHKADSDREAADRKAALDQEIRAHLTDLATAPIAVDLEVNLGHLADVAPSHREITRHALETVPPAADPVLPAGLVRLRRQQAQASAAIQAQAAQLVRGAAVPGADP